MIREERKRNLGELWAEVKKMVSKVGRPGYPFAHNLVGILLRQIADAYGKDEANRAIRNFGLKRKGWSEEPR